VSKLLLVEDDKIIGDVLTSSLQAQGHEVTWSRTGLNALEEAQSARFELVLLDLGLPDLDGVEVCRQLRTHLPASVLVMLTARTEEMDVVLGLEAGADDYLTKPVRLAELLARVRAHLRRVKFSASAQPILAVGDLIVDTSSRKVTIGEHEIPLRGKEFDLLARLAMAANVAVSRATLMADVWDEHWFGSTKTLDVHVAALRGKLSTAGAFGAVPKIVTLRGHGYRLETPHG
jgi:DNA-binding response OmpR family regulator